MLSLSLGTAIGTNRKVAAASGGGSSAPEPPPLVGYDTDIYAAVIDVDTGGTGDYNAASDTTAPGANSRNSQTFTFEDAANDDYRITDADTGAKGFGSPEGDAWDYGFDIAGTAWKATPSIGANEP